MTEIKLRKLNCGNLNCININVHALNINYVNVNCFEFKLQCFRIEIGLNTYIVRVLL